MLLPACPLLPACRWLQRRAREFDEMRDTPAFDLILVMDSYDEHEVLREVGGAPARATRVARGRAGVARRWRSKSGPTRHTPAGVACPSQRRPRAAADPLQAPVPALHRRLPCLSAAG